MKAKPVEPQCAIDLEVVQFRSSLPAMELRGMAGAHEVDSSRPRPQDKIYESLGSRFVGDLELLALR